MIMQNVPSLRYVLLDAGFHGHKSDYTSSKDPIDEAGIDVIGKKLNLGRWNFYGALYVGSPKDSSNTMWLTMSTGARRDPQRALETHQGSLLYHQRCKILLPRGH